jgi:hypothetical protein
VTGCGITALTRREIFDYIRTEGGPWWGRLDEVDFLSRVYDLDALPSRDYRFKTARNSRFAWKRRDPKSSGSQLGLESGVEGRSPIRPSCGRQKWEATSVSISLFQVSRRPCPVFTTG